MFDSIIKHYNMEGEVIPFEDWIKLVEDPDYRKVDRTEFSENEFVSTVLLGLDHNFGGHGPPKIFETMSHENGEWVEQVRYATKEEAKAGHAVVVARVLARQHLRQHPFGRVIELEEVENDEG